MVGGCVKEWEGVAGCCAIGLVVVFSMDVESAWRITAGARKRAPVE